MRQRKVKSFGLDFYVYLLEGNRNKILSSVSYLLNVEDEPLTYRDSMAW